MNYSGISVKTLEDSLNVYYTKLQSWNITEEKRQQCLTRIDEIGKELESRVSKCQSK